MKACLRIIFCLLLIMGIAKINLPIVLAQEEELPPPELAPVQEEVPLEEASGSIASVDLVNSSLVIKQLKDKENQIYEDVTIYLDNLTTIEKDNQAIKLPELTVGEEATIEYTINDEGKNIASYIWIESKKQ